MNTTVLSGRAPLARRLAPALVLVAAMLWLFRDTAASMVSIWMRSDTFAHAFLVPPISLWLIWRQRHALAGLPVRPLPWLLLPMAAVCLVWLLAQLAIVDAASQFALVTLMVLSVPALYGWAITRELLFPLAFLYFAVPFGEFLVPTLIEHTADFTVKALQLSGIPVYREGNNFIIPSGNWSVVEACSGVRYLIASLMVGTLFAYLNYRSLSRRLVFIGVAILVPIVANWLRAYMIVMIGHLSGNRLAVGVDHLLYGWVFFGVVISIMFLIGARWAESPEVNVEQARHPPVDEHAVQAWGTAAAVLALLAATQGLLWRMDHALEEQQVSLRLPDGGTSEPALPFQPGFRNPSAQRSATYMRDGKPVWLWVGYYRHQHGDRKFVSTTNTVVASDDKRWNEVARETRSASMTDGVQHVRVVELTSATSLHGTDGQRLRVWQLYWVDGRFTASDARAKLTQALARLWGKGDDGAVLLIATESAAGADERLLAFLASSIGDVNASLAASRERGLK